MASAPCPVLPIRYPCVRDPGAEIHDQTGRLVAYLLGGLLFLAIMAFRLRRAMASRPFRLQYIWVLAAIFLVLTVLTLAARRPQGMQWLWLALALAVGLGVG